MTSPFANLASSASSIAISSQYLTRMPSNQALISLLDASTMARSMSFRAYRRSMSLRRVRNRSAFTLSSMSEMTSLRLVDCHIEQQFGAAFEELQFLVPFAGIWGACVERDDGIEPIGVTRLYLVAVRGELLRRSACHGLSMREARVYIKHRIEEGGALPSITEKQQSIFARPRERTARPQTSPTRAPEAAGSWGQGSGRASMSPQGSRAGRSQRASQPQ